MAKSHVRTGEKEVIYKSGREPSAGSELAKPLVLGVPVSRTSGIVLGQHGLTGRGRRPLTALKSSKTHFSFPVNSSRGEKGGGGVIHTHTADSV